MRAAVLVAVLVTGLLKCAYSAPAGRYNANAIVQEIHNVLAQNGGPGQQVQVPQQALLCEPVAAGTIGGQQPQRHAQQVAPLVAAGLALGAPNFVNGVGASVGWWGRKKRDTAAQPVITMAPLRMQRSTWAQEQYQLQDLQHAPQNGEVPALVLECVPVQPEAAGATPNGGLLRFRTIQ